MRDACWPSRGGDQRGGIQGIHTCPEKCGLWTSGTGPGLFQELCPFSFIIFPGLKQAGKALAQIFSLMCNNQCDFRGQMII